MFRLGTEDARLRTRVFQVGSRNDKILLGGLAGAGLLAAAALTYRRTNRYSFKGKTVLITGGSRGLGLVLAREFSRERARIAICARDGAELGRAKTDLEARGAEVETFVCDVTDRIAVTNLIDEVEYRFGRIDVLVNNAGIIRVGPLELQTQQDFEEAMRLHFWAPFYAMQAVLPKMKRRGSGRIVNISSIGGKIAMPHLASYSASKFALAGLSSAMRSELTKYGVYVTTVCPGLMRTGSHVNAEFKGQNEKEYALFSIMDALPVMSVSAESAARQVTEAARCGDAELIISIPAKFAAKLNALFPNLTSELLSITDRFLPRPGTSGTEVFKGLESTSSVSPSWITSNIDAAAGRNNELKPNEQIN